MSGEECRANRKDAKDAKSGRCVGLASSAPLRLICSVFVALGFVFTACSAQQRAPATATQPMAPGSDPRAQIDELSKQIDAQREQMALPAPTVASCEPQCVATPMAVPMSVQNDAQCHPGQSDTCRQTCTLSDAICSNSNKICQLAQSLPGDTWAAGKCDAGKATCESAHAKCCSCTP